MFSEEEEVVLFNEVKLIKLFYLYLFFYKYYFVEKKEKRIEVYVYCIEIFFCVNILWGFKFMKCIVINCKWYIYFILLFVENKIDIIIGFKMLSNGL